MADLKLTVDSSDLLELQRTIDQMGPRFRQLAARTNAAVGPTSRLSQEYMRLVAQSNKAATAQQRLGVAAQATGRKMNRGGVLMQQTGYQVGDFIVQVQSGTNWMVAFGQQATQVAGTLTLLGGKFILLGSVLGIAIPLVTALGAAWMRTRESSEEAEEQLRSVAEVLRDLEGLRDLEIDIRVSEQFGEILELLRFGLTEELRASLAEFRANFQEALIPDIAPMEANLARLQEQLVTMQETMATLPEGSIGVYEQQIEGIRRQIEEQNSSLREQQNLWTILNGISGQNRQQLAESLQLAIQRLQTEGLYTQEVQRLLAAFAEANNLSAILADNQEEARQSATGMADLLADVESALNLAGEEATQMAESFGLSVAEARALAGIGFGNIWDGAAGAAQLASNLAAAAAATRNFAGREDAINGNQPVAGDPRIMSSTGYEVLPQTTGNTDALSGFTGAEALDGIPASFGSSGGGGGGGGSGGFVSMFPQLAAEVEMANQAMQAAQQEQEMLNTALEQGIITQEQYKAMMGEVEAAYGTLNVATQEHIVTMGEFASSMAQTMSNSFMSILDGTKSVGDAIKDMIKKIISEFIKLAVINPILNSLFGGIGGFSPLPAFSFNAKGNAFSAGSIIPFAKGGVVDSSMMFPMSGGKTGIMGEAGPEAILPLSRGKGGKLGVQAEGLGQQNVVFQMSYNFQGGITEADLARATPQIVEQTKRSVVEAVKRGGSFKKAFN